MIFLIVLVVSAGVAVGDVTLSPYQVAQLKNLPNSWCMAECSKPDTEFCHLTTDVCAYPDGDGQVRLALESLSVLSPGNDCLTKFKLMLCRLYFPVCVFGQTLPLCHQNCLDAYTSCGLTQNDAANACGGFVKTGQVAAPKTQCAAAVKIQLSWNLLFFTSFLFFLLPLAL